MDIYLIGLDGEGFTIPLEYCEENEIKDGLMKHLKDSGHDYRTFFIEESGELEYTMHANGIALMCEQTKTSIDKALEDIDTFAIEVSKNGCHDVLVLCVQFGAKHKLDSDGASALVYSVENYSLDDVELLVNNGFSAETSKECQSPLYIASGRGDMEIVSILLGRCDGISSEMMLKSSDIAFDNTHFDIFELIIEKNKEISYRSLKTILESNIEWLVESIIKNNVVFSHEIIKYIHNLDVLKQFLGNKNVRVSDITVRNVIQEENIDKLILILKYVGRVSDICIRESVSMFVGEISVILAKHNRRFGVTVYKKIESELLEEYQFKLELRSIDELQKLVDMDNVGELVVTDEDGNTQLHVATMLAKSTYVALLKNYGGDIQNKHGDTPLHVAVRLNNKKMTANLKNTDLFIKNNYDESPFSLAKDNILSILMS